MNRIFVSAAHKSSGKTTISLGIAAALRARSEDFVIDPGSGARCLLVDVKSHRGHELGSIGLVLGRDGAAPPAAAMRAAIVERFRGTV